MNRSQSSGLTVQLVIPPIPHPNPPNSLPVGIKRQVGNNQASWTVVLSEHRLKVLTAYSKATSKGYSLQWSKLVFLHLPSLSWPVPQHLPSWWWREQSPLQTGQMMPLWQPCKDQHQHALVKGCNSLCWFPLSGMPTYRWEDSIREWTGLEFGKSQRGRENREKWRKLVAKSSVVPQRPLRLRN